MFKRYAIFYTPPDGPLAAFGAVWLGWDSAIGERSGVPQVAGLDVSQITRAPRKYGFHGTLKAPFRLGSGQDVDDLRICAERFAATHAPVGLDRLDLQHHHGFVAVRPSAPSTGLNQLAADVVRDFDSLRAPLNAAEIARRRSARLTPQQDAQMLNWGYPFVFDDFHFHLTLTGPVDSPTAQRVIAALEPSLAPLISAGLAIDAITLMGEDDDGHFHQIQRYPLAG